MDGCCRVGGWRGWWKSGGLHLPVKGIMGRGTEMEDLR